METRQSPSTKVEFRFVTVFGPNKTSANNTQKLTTTTLLITWATSFSQSFSLTNKQKPLQLFPLLRIKYLLQLLHFSRIFGGYELSGFSLWGFQRTGCMAFQNHVDVIRFV